jgi:pimeloyl-ACP methyl ester carboxylesterase
MLKKLFLFLLLFCSGRSCYSQASIPYGNNPAAGKYIPIRGIKMYCEVYGEGPPLLMIHGNGGSMAAFSKIAGWFSKKYQVILVDSRAHGKSTDNQDSLSFEMMADDFSALLDALKIPKTYVIGWSDGGINALLLAMRHPDKVIRLASTGANLWPDSTAFTSSAWNDIRGFYYSSKDKIRKTPQEKNDWKIFMLDWLQPNIPLSALQAIQCPSLIICGDHDMISLEHTVLIYQHIPKANLWIVPNSGHATLIEHTEDFDKKVDEFFH